MGVLSRKVCIFHSSMQNNAAHQKFCVFKLVLIVQIIICAQNGVICETTQSSNSGQFASKSPHPDRVLKICKTGGFKNDGIVEIPTFLRDRFAYELRKYRISKSNLMTACPNGEMPDLHSEVTLSKSDFDQEYEASDFSEQILFELLRAGHFLLESGYLSVGNGSAQDAVYYSPDEFCINSIQGTLEDTTLEFKTCSFPDARPIFYKCCPLGMVLDANTCVPNIKGEELDPGYLNAKTGKVLPVDKANPVYTSALLQCESDSREMWEADNCSYEFHPVTDSTVAYMGAYRTFEFLNSSVAWCMDTMDLNGTQRLVIIHCAGKILEEEDEKHQARISLLYMINMYIGAIFHFCTTLVYLIIWPKQNIHGKTLCSCTASLFFMQIFLGTAHLLGRISNQGRTPLCVVNSIGGQYFMIAAFTWLLIVNYDLWRTFRTIRADSNSSGKRFLMFSAFGWLFPLLVSIISISLDFSFKCRVSRVPVPEFGEYYCFVAPWAQGYYVYYILSVLITLVFVLAVLTLYGLYTFKKDTANLRSNKRADDQQNVVLFLKLSVVMGLTWVFEVISWAATKENENHIGWIVLDLYNALSAILIFIFFVCKRTTLNMLEQSCPIFKGITSALSKLSSTFSGDSSVDNTLSTGVDGGGNSSVHKKSVDAQSQAVAVPLVRYTKRTAEQENGSTSKPEN